MPTTALLNTSGSEGDEIAAGYGPAPKRRVRATFWYVERIGSVDVLVGAPEGRGEVAR